MDTGLDYENNNESLEIENNYNEQEDLLKEIDYKQNLLEEKKEISNVDILYEKLQKQFVDSNLIIKTLHNNLKLLYKEVLKERKELQKKSNKNNKKKKEKK